MDWGFLHGEATLRLGVDKIAPVGWGGSLHSELLFTVGEVRFIEEGAVYASAISQCCIKFGYFFGSVSLSHENYMVV